MVSALTKLDVLDTFKEIKICTAITKGKKIDYFPQNETHQNR